MPVVTLPDGSNRRYDNPVTVADIAADIGPGLAKAALAGKVNGAMVDTSFTIDEDAELAIITGKSDEALELIRHDAAHVMAQAVQELYPGTQVTIGPAIEDGFYYDFAREEPFHPDDLKKIEDRMREIVGRDLPIQREVWERDAGDASLCRHRRGPTRSRSSTTSSRRARRSPSTARATGSTSAVVRTCPARASCPRRSS